MDRIGHRRLQLAGFAMMGPCFAVIAAVPGTNADFHAASSALG
jgi:hypothetical protein